MVIFLDIFVDPTLTLDGIFKQIFGLNQKSAEFILLNFGLKGRIRLDELEEEESLALEEFISRNFVVNKEAKLKYEIRPVQHSLREYRFEQKLPMNGQRTHSNAQTRRKYKPPKPNTETEDEETQV